MKTDLNAEGVLSVEDVAEKEDTAAASAAY
jgi:hypothetical protein